MIENAWIVPLFPLLSFLVLILFGRRFKESSFKIAIFLTLLSTIFSILVLFERFTAPTYKSEALWLAIGEVQLTVGFEVNQLNALMLVIVSLVSFLVHTYSAGYMKGDDRFSVYYAYLGLFTFAMLGLVLSPNLLQTYIFWELVGVGSFLLIGFYFYKEEAKQAAKKAFIMTRIGDVGLLIGMILLFWQVGSFEYDEIFQAVSDGCLVPRDDYVNGNSHFYRCCWKIGSVPAPYLASGCNGRSDTCVCTDSCRNNGSSRGLFSGNGISTF